MANKLMQRLGGNVARLRQVKGLTQSQVAGSLDVNTETISRFEHGVLAPSLPTLDRLAAILGVELPVLGDGVSTNPDGLAREMANLVRPLQESDRVLLLGVLKQLCHLLY
ncbi:helix-turn-helix domain-containing protein [Chitinilyticum piscinae]|uniref:Helix-turn-helix transcriptional regulator n=1 Tax=Chitinilyticum piscinae TaxID=2866724 RepID=A0A8J7FKA1_9NEIS|nr:helix-turn-helix transcriptional regulator [Chitinilyticum piscinae]MBE9611035.1 helix-turn-helix transcriptional regulator [Chitinilyticum piscinae]